MSLDTNDNIIVGAGTGGSTQGAEVATDFVNARHYQIFKQAFGANGDATDVGDGSGAAKPLPVKLFQADGIVLSSELLASDLSVLNVNLRGTSGSGNVPVDINAMNLGEIRIAGTAGGVPVGVCGDNFDVRTLFGATAGNTLTSIFSHGGDFDSVSVQGISGGFPVGITATNLHIRSLTSADEVSIANGGGLAGVTLQGGTLDHVTVFGGETGYGGDGSVEGGALLGNAGGLPVFIYGNSGGTAAAIGMSGDQLKVVLDQTLSASGSFTATVDSSHQKSVGFDTTGVLSAADTSGNTLATPVLLYGQSGGDSTIARALTVTGGGALLTALQGDLQATIGTVNVSIPDAFDFASTRLLTSPSGNGNTMGQPVLLYGSSGGDTIAKALVTVGDKGLGDGGLLVAGVIGVTNAPGGPLEITHGANTPDVVVTSMPNVTVSTISNTVTVKADANGMTLGGGDFGSGVITGGTLDNITLATVQASGTGITVFGGVTGFGFVSQPRLHDGPGVTMGTPVFLYGNSGDGDAAAIGASAGQLLVSVVDGVKIDECGATLSVVAGTTGYGGDGTVEGGAVLGNQRAMPTLLYGNSGGTASAVGMSGDNLKVSIDRDLSVSLTDVALTIPANLNSTVNTVDGAAVEVEVVGNAYADPDGTINAGDTFHAFGLTGGYANDFGLTAGGTFGSSVMVCGISGPDHPVKTQNMDLIGISNDILDSIRRSFWSVTYPSSVPTIADQPTAAGGAGDNPPTGIWGQLESIKTSFQTRVAIDLATSANLGTIGTNLGTIDSQIDRVVRSEALNSSTVHDEIIGEFGDSRLRVEVADVKLPDPVTPAFGNTSGVLPAAIHDTPNVAVRLTAHKLTKGMNVKNTSGTGILHVGYADIAGALPTGENDVIGQSYRLLASEEVFLETNNLANLWVASCPGASGCYIGG